MYPFDRWLIRLYGLLAAIGIFWILLILLQFSPVVQLTVFVLDQQIAWLWVGLVLLLAISFRYLAFPLQSHQRTRSFIRETDGGQIRIGYDTVKEIANRAVRQVKGVQRIQIKINESEQGLVIYANVHADPMDLNAMSEEIQQIVFQSIRNMTSLTIAAVHVHVVELSPDHIQK